jgi:hypothetical protein
LQKNFGVEVSVITDSISKDPLLIIFDVAETHPQINELEQFLSTQISENIKADTYGLETFSLLYRPVYSEEELKSAEWLIMRNTFNKVDPTNYHDAFCSACHSSPADEEKNWAGISFSASR